MKTMAPAALPQLLQARGRGGNVRPCENALGGGNDGSGGSTRSSFQRQRCAWCANEARLRRQAASGLRALTLVPAQNRHGATCGVRTNGTVFLHGLRDGRALAWAALLTVLSSFFPRVRTPVVAGVTVCSRPRWYMYTLHNIVV